MSEARRTIMTGLRLGLEGTYGVPATLSDEDYVLLVAPAVVARKFLPGSEWGRDARTGNQLQRVEKAGCTITTTLITDLSGGQTPSSLPHGADRLLRLSGMRVSDGPQGARLYEPWHEGYPSGTAEIFTREMARSARGCQVTGLGLSAPAGGIPRLTSELVGILSDTYDAAAPAAPAADLSSPVKFDAKGSALNNQALGTWAPIVRSLQFTLDRQHVVSPDANAPGSIGGITLGRITTSATLVVEAAPLWEFDPYGLAAAGTVMPLRIVFRTGKRWWYLVAEQAQIISVGDTAEGATALWNITLMLGNRYSAMSPCWLMTAPVQI